MRSPLRRALLPVLTAIALLVAFAACGDDDTTDTDTDTGASGDRPVVVVTTSVLGDVVAELVGEHFDVVTVMGPGVDPHEFQASAQQVAQIRDADALVVNGGGFEHGLDDVIDAATDDGVPTFVALDHVDVIDAGEHAHDHGDEDHADEDHGDEDHADEDHADEDHADEDHADEDHADEDHADEDHADEDHADEDHADEDHGDEDHGDGGADPHFFTDPSRMADAADALVEELATLDVVDADVLRADAAPYLDELRSLDAEVEQILQAVPAARRQLVLDHDVFGYFADRYDFTVIGSVLGSISTSGSVSPGDLADLADEVAEAGVDVVFAGATNASDLVETLADEVDIDIVSLYTESLVDDEEGSSYLGMVRANAERIAEALGS